MGEVLGGGSHVLTRVVGRGVPDRWVSLLGADLAPAVASVDNGRDDNCDDQQQSDDHPDDHSGIRVVPAVVPAACGAEERSVIGACPW